MRRVRVAPPARHEPLGDRRALVDPRLRHRRHADPARRLRHVGQRHHRRPGQLLAGLVVADVQQRPVAPVRGEHGQRGLHVHPHVAGVHRQRERLGRRQPGPEPAVDQQRPDVAEAHPADQVLDVDAAVAQRPAVPVRLGDLGAEGDVPLQAGAEAGRRRGYARSADTDWLMRTPRSLLAVGPAEDGSGVVAGVTCTGSCPVVGSICTRGRPIRQRRSRVVYVTALVRRRSGNLTWWDGYQRRCRDGAAGHHAGRLPDRRSRRRAIWLRPGTSSWPAGWPRPRRPATRSRTRWCWPPRARTAARPRAPCCARAWTPAASCSTPTTPRPRATTCGPPATPRPPSPGTPSTGRCTCAARWSWSSPAETQAYWATRPRGSQLGAWASAQSTAVRDRRVLDDALAGVEQRFADLDEVPLPGHWGGWRIRPGAGGVLAGPARPDARPAALRGRRHRPHLEGHPPRPVIEPVPDSGGLRASGHGREGG